MAATRAGKATEVLPQVCGDNPGESVQSGGRLSGYAEVAGPGLRVVEASLVSRRWITD
jgi:hypothetical protein